MSIMERVSPSAVNADVIAFAQTTHRRRRLSNFHLPSSARPSIATPMVPERLKPLAQEQSRTPIALSAVRSTRRVTIASPSRTSVHPAESDDAAQLSDSNHTPKTLVRSHRRSSYAFPTEITTRTPIRRSRGRTSHRAPLTGVQLNAIYSSTIRLCQDNKINSRNTWTLNLIDYMPMLVSGSQTSATTDQPIDQLMSSSAEYTSHASSADTDFQLAGATLDAGVRIYCSRVDSVHTNAFKVLGDLSQTRPVTGDDGEVDDHSDSNEDDQNSTRNGETHKKTGASGKPGRCTLVSNLQTITLNRLETDLMVDPLFQNMSAAFDDGGASGMLVHNLPLAPTGAIIFDSAESADILIPTSAISIPDPAVGQRDQSNNDNQSAFYEADLDLPPLPGDNDEEANKICPRFFDLLKSELGSTRNEVSLPSLTSGISSMPSSWPADDDNMSVAPFEYDGDELSVLNSAGLSLQSDSAVQDTLENDEQDSGIVDEDDVIVPGSANDVNTQSASLWGSAKLSAAHRGTIDLVEAGVPLEGSEYSFFGSTLAASGWAGPLHWRFRPGVGGVGDVRGTEKGKRRRPRGRMAQLLDFSADAPDINFEKLFAPGKSEDANQLTKGVRAAMTEDKVTLPEDFHLSPRSLMELFLRPGTFVTSSLTSTGLSQGLMTSSEDAPSWFDYEKDRGLESQDVEGAFAAEAEIVGDNICEADHNGLDDDESFDNDNDVGFDTSECTNLTLVQEPMRVQTLDINYSKVAKRVDVRALKSGLWSRLCGEVYPCSTGYSSCVTQQDSSSPDERNTETRKNFDVRRGDEVRLKDVVRDAQSFVPVDALQNVTLPYVFICLLHLANEHGLHVVQASDCESTNSDGAKKNDASSLNDLVITFDGT